MTAAQPRPFQSAPNRFPRRGLGVMALAVGYWTAIELWGQALNQLNGVAASQGLLAGQVLGVCGGAAITTLSYHGIRSAGAATLRARLTVGAGAAIAGSAAYALWMIALSRIVPVAQPQGATGAARFAWEMLFFLPPFSLSTAFVLVLEAVRLVRERDRSLSEALILAREGEVRALHYQVNPHFLYNALNSLSTLILDGRADEADQMVHHLAAFFRSNITADPLSDVPLSEEVAKQRLYLSLEEIRFKGRLDVAFDIPGDLAAALVPRLILQPLVENAVRHGIHEPGRATAISVKARADGATLLLEVRDDGPGEPTGATQGTGIGLENVRRRLHARFADQATLRAGRDPAGGFAAKIAMPLVWADPTGPPERLPAL